MKRKEPSDYIDENKLEECRKRIKYLPNNIQKKHETNDYLNRTNELDLKINHIDKIYKSQYLKKNYYDSCDSEEFELKRPYNQSRACSIL